MKDEAARSYDEVQILIVDDDEISVMALQRAIRQLRLANPVRVAKDGLQALDVLRGSNGQEAMLPPFIVLLDINMPRMDGHEFLEEVRNDPRLQNAIIFVLTTSDAPADIAQAYAKNVAGYVVKERPVETFRQTLELVDHYSRLVVIPK